MAGRIPQYFIDDLLSRIDIVDLIDRHVPLKKGGKDYKACCPFHDEKTPSFTVSQDKQFYHCFGCSAHGTAISFMMEYDQMEFRDAVEHLADLAGIQIPVEIQPAHEKRDKGPDLYALLEKASHYYQARLRDQQQASGAVAYLKHRGLSGEIARHYGIGFVPDGWDNILNELGKTDSDKDALMDAGMLSRNEKGRIYDRFRNRIMFPIQDYRGRIIGFGGRVVDDSEPKYLNSPETPVFHKGAELYGLYAARKEIREKQFVFVVEGYMDVVALAQHGIGNPVATLGTATTKQHLDRLFRHCPHIIFCFDGDRAGRDAAWRALETSLPAMQDGRQISFMFLPDGEDPDTMVRETGKEEFLHQAEESVPLPEFLLEHLSDQADLSRLDGRARLVNLAKPLLSKLPDGILRNLVTDRLAGMTGTDSRTITRHTGSSQSPSAGMGGRRQYSPSRQPPPSAIRRAISLLLQNPGLAAACDDLAAIEESGERGFSLFASLVRTVREHPGLNTASLLERFRDTPDLSALEKLATSDHLLEAESMEEAFHAVLRKLDQQILEQRTEALLTRASEAGLNDEEKSLLKQLLSESGQK